MGLERRGNGVYFYEKVRIGSKVVSRYCGSGDLAMLCAETATLARSRRKDDRELARAKLAGLNQEWFDFDSVESTIKADVAEFLASAGLHRQNRGPWRRKRNAKE